MAEVLSRVGFVSVFMRLAIHAVREAALREGRSNLHPTTPCPIHAETRPSIAAGLPRGCIDKLLQVLQPRTAAKPHGRTNTCRVGHGRGHRQRGAIPLQRAQPF